MDITELLDPVTILLFFVVLWLTYMYMTWPYRYFEKHGIPGDKPVPIFGNWRELGKKPIHLIDREMIKKHGKIVGCYNGWLPEIIITDLDMIKQLTVKDADNFTDRRFLPLRGIVKHSIFDVRGETWKRQRSLITPFFSSGKLKLNSKRISTVLTNMVKNLRDSDDKEREIKYIASCFSLDVICSVGFGVEVESLINNDHPLVKSTRQLVADFAPTNPWFIIQFLLPSLAGFLDKFDVSMFSKSALGYVESVARSLIKQKEDGNKEAQEFVTALVKAHHEELDYESKKAEGNGNSIKHKGMNENEIVANAILFIAAGYDTTATGLSFLLFLLTTNEECQQTLYEEIDKELGKEEPTYENIQKLEYLDWCIDEALRMYPPVSRYDRTCTTPTKLGDLTIPKGMLVTVPVWCLHMDPEVWPNPDKYDPLRFSPEVKKNRNPLNFQTFGHGARQCVGLRLALLEMKMATATIIQNFKLVPNTKTKPIDLLPFAVFATAKDGLWISVQPRE